MSSLAHSLVTSEEFVWLPERPETGQHYELQDGEVIVVPPARPLHIKLQKHIERLLEATARDRGVVTREFWVVDAERRTVQVTDLGGSKVYAPGEAIPLRLFGNAALAVDRIFVA